MNGPKSPAPRDARAGRAAAILEVLVAFTLVHASYRALKQFTALGAWDAAAGTNFIPGAAMFLFTVSALWFCRRNFEEYGLTLKNARASLTTGLLAGLLAMAGLVLVAILLPHHANAPHLGMTEGLVGAAAYLAGAGIMVWIFRRRTGFLDRIPPIRSLALLTCLLLLPVLLAFHFHRPVSKVASTAAWTFFGAGFGEETFFRGYIQSRVNLAFGRPWRILGTEFGWGVIVSSMLFGLLHVLNTCDYFRGHFEFAWWYGCMALFSGLFYGCLREKTGSILAGGIAHGLGDVLAQTARFFQL